jgi:hypothetical protein
MPNEERTHYLLSEALTSSPEVWAVLSNIRYFSSKQPMAFVSLCNRARLSPDSFKIAVATMDEAYAFWGFVGAPLVPRRAIVDPFVDDLPSMFILNPWSQKSFGRILVPEGYVKNSYFVRESLNLLRQIPALPCLAPRKILASNDIR